MPTNAIGAGTCNVAINMTREERAMWGRVAGTGRSLGEMLRALMVTGLERENPAVAAEIRRIRRERRLAKAVLLLAAGLWSGWLGMQPRHDLAMRRPARVRVVRSWARRQEAV